MRFLMVVLLFGYATLAEPNHNSTCTPATTQRTNWGHMNVALDLQDKPVKVL